METEEDEDVIFEGSLLHKHLLDAGYSEPVLYYHKTNVPLENTYKTNKQYKRLQTWLSARIRNFSSVQQELEERFSQEIVTIIINTPLVSVEDADFLANMFDSRLTTEVFELKRPKVRFGDWALGGVALAIMMLSTPRLPWLLRAPTFFFTGYNMVQSIYRKINQSRFDKLQATIDKFKNITDILHDLCSLMSKTVQFIQEMELIDRGFTLPNLVTHLSIKTIGDQPSALLCLPLRGEVMEIINELLSLARRSTLKIRKCVPLGSSLDNDSHYLACAPHCPTIEFDQQKIPLQTIKVALRQCNLQLSEMLRRLALCFLVTPDQHRCSPVTIFNTDIKEQILNLNQRLRLAFDYYASWKVVDKEEETVTNQQAESAESQRSKGLDVALHCLERHLRASALIIKDFSSRPDEYEIQLKHERQAVATCWELLVAELKKLAAPQQPVTSTAIEHCGVTAKIVEETGDVESVPLYGLWDAHIQDEILEADLHNELVELTEEEEEPFIWQTREQRREMASQTKRLYSELQLVLKSKAAEWKEREAKVMERLGKPVSIEEEALVVDDSASHQENVKEEVAKFVVNEDTSSHLRSNFSLQASLASQVRLLASQRTRQDEDIIGDSDDEESVGSTSQSSYVDM